MEVLLGVEVEHHYILWNDRQKQIGKCQSLGVLYCVFSYWELTLISSRSRWSLKWSLHNQLEALVRHRALHCVAWSWQQSCVDSSGMKRLMSKFSSGQICFDLSAQVPIIVPSWPEFIHLAWSYIWPMKSACFVDLLQFQQQFAWERYTYS